MANNYYSGQGTLYAAARNELTAKPFGLRSVGNMPECTINIETSKIEHKESQTGSRLTDLTLVTEKKGTIELTLEDVSIENLALGLWGSSAVVAGAAVVDEVVSLYSKDTAVRYALAHPSVTAVTVTGAGGTPAYVVDTDYVVDAKHGVISIVPGGAIAIALAAVVATPWTLNIEVGYTYAGYLRTDAFTSATAPVRWLRFEGLNTVDGSSVIVDVYKVQFEPLTGYSLINEELASITLTGTILADLAQPGDSKFFRQINA